MVRLNEPPVLGDTIEALKRRFIRQNREIARANSTQSAKIRTLECETSQLLSENIALREENIKLQQALEESQRQNGSTNLSLFKEQFESKMQELNELLGHLSTTSVAKEPRTTPGKPRRKAARQSLFQRMRPTPAQLTENAAAEGRLAPIFENGSVLKDDFDDDVRLSIPDVADVTNSPDLGPPTNMHDDGGDPVKSPFANKELFTGSPPGATKTERNPVHQSSILSANLETRKSRKENTISKDSEAEVKAEAIENRTEDRNVPEPIIKEAPPRTGAKRKLGSREEDSKSLSRSSSQQSLGSAMRSNYDDNGVRRTKSHVNLSSIGASLSKVQSKSATSLGASQNRKALGDKPVNTDPVVSPGKPIQVNTDKSSDMKELTTKPRERTSAKEKSTIRQIRPLKAHVDDTQLASEEPRRLPKTPAINEDDIFSPDSMRASSTKSESRDTPPPGDLQDVNAGAAGRASRRQRSAVSYAEPSLRDKMRRPGKEMVDAISGLQRSRASISELSNRDEYLHPEDGKSERVSIHLDNETGIRSLKTKEPTSPLTSRSTSESTGLDTSVLPTATLADRRRRSTATAHSRVLSAEEGRSSNSQETISALISSSQKKLARVGASSFGSQPSETETSSLVDSLSVFDLHLSSPPRGDSATEEQVRAESGSRAGRANKRHSSVSEGISRMAKERESASKRGAEEMSGDESRADPGGLRRAERAGRRRSMMV